MEPDDTVPWQDWTPWHSPFFIIDGRLRFMSNPQRRFVDGKWEYRSREETDDQFWARQW